MEFLGVGDVQRSLTFVSDLDVSNHCLRRYSCALSAKAPAEN